MSPRPTPAALALALALTLTLVGPALTLAQDADARDRLKRLQSANVESAARPLDRAYHFGSQGKGSVYSNHESHTNRLIPFYTFGKALDAGTVTGANSVYRDAARLRALYGFLPPNTVNPEAEYADQSDFAGVLAAARDRGARHLFIVWFDGLDWTTTQAAAVAKSHRVYTEGRGSGLFFQDYAGAGPSGFGWFVTSPTHDANVVDVDAQRVAIPAGSFPGGYDAQIAGPNPWTPGPLAARAPGYLKGQGGDERDLAEVRALGRFTHAYTDSSTSAAEFVSGRKSYNNSVNALEDGKFVAPLFPGWQAQGWKVGTVTSVPFPHASPAAMYARDVDRDDYQDIARDMLGLESVVARLGKGERLPGLDVVIGTGFGREANAKGLLAQGRNAVPGNLYLTDADRAAIDARRGGRYVVAQTERGVAGGPALRAAAADAAARGARLFGFYGDKGFDHLPFQTADGRFDPVRDTGDDAAEVYTPDDLRAQPTLADMTAAALTVLGTPKGKPFALFVEAGDVDFALHANNLDNAVGAVYSGEAAIRVITDWVEAHSNWDESAMIVTADHGHYLVIDDLNALAGPK